MVGSLAKPPETSLGFLAAFDSARPTVSKYRAALPP